MRSTVVRGAPARADRCAGALLAAMVALSTGAVVLPVLTLPAAVTAWVAAVLLLPRTTPRQRMVALVLMSIGMLGMGVGLGHGQTPDWRTALTANQALVAMLVAVTFLGLVTRTSHPLVRRPRGRRAVVQTLLGVHVLGAVINVPAVDLVAAPITPVGGMDRPRILLLSRAFSAAAFWSPFWGAMAAVTTYTANPDLTVVIPLGIATATVAMALSLPSIFTAFGKDLANFDGYPITTRAMVVPASMVAAVLVLHTAFRDTSLVSIVALSALIVSAAGLLTVHPTGSVIRVKEHVAARLPQTNGEVTLFLSAGVLIAGVTQATEALELTLPLATTTWWHAWLLLLAMVILALLGLHPVVTIAVASALMTDSTTNPTLLAMTGLLAWGIQAAAGPITGLNVVLHGRYGIDSFTIARWNLPHAVSLMALSVPVLWGCTMVTSS